ncbi:RdRP-domain-containing protein [Dothidotthia symphoricarpi CBS 119687]|uniref:RNA-dependent RNA polymerase n=1 Tax=Dothidotthia symphoricarpi CBS 119687 TaxID=1392245 RepID=A0A6A6AFQ5_9PLEO|nr:RdRP-domain-containing protein [Dothidotthia symphoricarpi CBS 119687]KAF2130133.1 RdRP-domain-containing protein [Dothidotthia symphoricarpi CBS 119687]
MDIFIQDVPESANQVELRIFLKDKLRRFDVLAFDVFKQAKNNWATITVANFHNGQRFLNNYGRGNHSLVFRFKTLRCRRSNRPGQPEALKVIALLHKEEEMRVKHSSRGPNTPTPGPSQPTFKFQTLMTGLWDYDRMGKLVFDQKYKDPRSGFVTFGKFALVLYLEKGSYHGYDWRCRIDIPYTILEHTIPSITNGNRGSITFTLKSPPKIYQIQTEEDLHLYTGAQPNLIPNGMPDFARLELGTSNKRAQVPRLERLCALQRSHAKNSALCMVYKLYFPNLPLAYQAFTFVKNASVPEVHWWKTMEPNKLTGTIEAEYADLERILAVYDPIAFPEFSFAVRFQLLALVLEGTITPLKMIGLVLVVRRISQQHGSELTANAIRKLGLQVSTPAPDVAASEFSLQNLTSTLLDNIQILKKADVTNRGLSKGRTKEHLALTYKATITPTGIILRGPDWGVTNRVLRKYSKHTECFMRVFIADEDGLPIFHDPRSSQSQIYERFRTVLGQGITVAGRTYSFLGFSHASLRYHQTWFMAPFEEDGKLIIARDVIQDLGDFSNIHCSAKCAARIGQAFSDSIYAVAIPNTSYVTETKDDVERNNRCFSDGCGTISLDLLQMVWRSLPPERRERCPTILQIRYRGAKGVLSLDTSLHGEQLHIRKSMTKYIAQEGWRDLELCGAAYRPLVMFLNHQFVKILEDLGIPARNFIEVQTNARDMLEMVIKHPLNAASFLDYSNSGKAAKVPRLFELLHYIGVPFHEDRFLTDIIEVAAMSSLRSLKYRARIPIEEGCLLYGIMDETNTLRENEVYIVRQIDDEYNRPKARQIIVRDRIVITRAPALHPGDIQVVKAVNVPSDCPLRNLHNCIVFSQQGARDLPSQLSGGDLDGDLFHIIWDKRLIPNMTEYPADYTAAPPRDLGRSVQSEDIVDFFIEFMKMDRLGQISNKHKIRADIKPGGTRDVACITLAKLASDAVDFSKSGNPADMSQIPHGTDHIRPDFMAPGPGLVINELGATELEELEEDDIDEPDSIGVMDPDRASTRYYRSDKVLGQLYRNIDERTFFNKMKGEFEAKQSFNGGESLVEKVDRYIDRETRGFQWDHHRTFAEDLREYYEENMLEIMDTLRPHRGKPLTELEVFSGNILGKKERASTRYIREANQEVKERFDRDVGAIVKRIVYGDEEWEGDGGPEALPRAVACFKIALETEGWQNYVTLKSWKYVAAAVCLEQLWRYRRGTLRPL